MRTEQRFILFVVLSFAMVWGMQFLFDKLGLLPKPAQPPVAAEEAAEAKKPGPETGKAEAEAEAKPVADAEKPKPNDVPKPPPAAVAKIRAVAPDKLVLGSSTDKTRDGYRLEVKLEQRGAGVGSLISSRIEAEYVDGKPQNRPLQLLEWDPAVPPSFALAIRDAKPQAPANPGGVPTDVELPVDSELWDVVPDAQGRLVRPIKNGQEVCFQRTLEALGVTLTKTYRLFRGEDGFDLELGFAADADRTLIYRMAGPHGIPIEGDWFTSTFRDVFFGRVEGEGVKIDTYTAYDIFKRKDDPERFRTLPLKYTGIENQYFAVLLEPVPAPRTREESWEDEVFGTVVRETKETQKSDVTVQILSKPLKVGPNLGRTHKFRVFAGPKTVAALRPFGATELSKYRKGWSLGPLGDLGASWVAANFIAPMLEHIYAATTYVSRLFGGRRGNYGVAIILLTITVRMILFPLGRKQARMAKKMQDLQPELTALKEKYKEDKEAMTRETFALYKQYKVNPMGGCLPALIQLPVLIGLWQALNNSVALRHSSFLWITNLAAPDMLFKFPFTIPLVGGWLGPYFNVLPLVVVGLMLVQTRLFAPPAVTEEQKVQQQTMNFMMVFMMFMFYKVPSGLGIYFITSSMWQIGERLLLPKPAAAVPVPPTAKDDDEERGGRGRGGPGGKGHGGPNGNGAKGWLDQARERLEAIVQEAQKDKTHRNIDREPDRDRGKTRPKPGRKR
jgi:YidC/Oxa1 family membrane protein insertase